MIDQKWSESTQKLSHFGVFLTKAQEIQVLIEHDQAIRLKYMQEDLERMKREQDDDEESDQPEVEDGNFEEDDSIII